MFTKHKWVVKEKQVLPSVLEQLRAAGTAPASATTYTMMEWAKKPCIVTYRCELTGEEKVERI